MWILDPAPGTKYSEVTDIWLLTNEELIGCFVQKLVKINTVDDVACSVSGFRLELVTPPIQLSSLGNGFFWWFLLSAFVCFWLLIFLAFSFSVFLFSAGREKRIASARDFGW